MKTETGIREIRREDASCLPEFLYQAIFVPEGGSPSPKSVLQEPGIAMYIEGFLDRPDDFGLFHVLEGKPVAAAWARIMQDYGHVDEKTPSLSISVLKGYRNRGIGSLLFDELLLRLKARGYHQVSLSVQKANYALKMYQKAGFETARENAEDLVMVKKL